MIFIIFSEQKKNACPPDGLRLGLTGLVLPARPD
jgi:hypothetical protein